MDVGQISWELLAFLNTRDRFLGKSSIFSGRCAKLLGIIALDVGRISWEFLAFLDTRDRFLGKSSIFSVRCAKLQGIYAIFKGT